MNGNHHCIAAQGRRLLRKRDFYAGGLMILVGLVAAYKGPSYQLGTLMRMGPGFMPTALGVLLILLGIVIAGSAVNTAEGEGEDILPEYPQWRGWGCILAGPVCFIIFGSVGGFIPATFSCVFVSALGDREFDIEERIRAVAHRHRLRRRGVFLSAASADAVADLGRPVIETALADLWTGFGVALEPHNLMWCFVGVLVGNMVGVLPGMGPLATISILLPLTFGIKPVGAILMLAGILYGAQYGGAICSILLNLPCHPPHAVTCLDGFPLTKQGKGGVALGLSVMGSFIGASWGITEMIFLAPVLVSIALEFGPADICSLMLLGLLAGSTLARGSPIKGVAMTVFGLLLGIVGTDVESGTYRLTFGMAHFYDGIELVALALGIFGIAEFMNSVNQVMPVNLAYSNVRLRDMRPSKSEVKQALPAMFRGTLVGSLCSLIPGTGPTIASFIAYAAEKKISKTPEKFGTGMIEGVVAPETSTHSSIQGDFIPTMSLGIPGDAVMALLLGALMIQGIVPGPQLINEHPDIFWGLVASFWIGNICAGAA